MKRSPVTNLITDRLAALSEMLRLRICRLLERQELSVGEIARVVQLPQSTVSRHLKVLSSAGWLDRRAEGTATMYRLVLDDLEPEARVLWLAVRDQLGGDVQVEDDSRRVEAVVAERRTDSVSFFGRIAGEWDDVRAELFGDEFTTRALLALLLAPPPPIVAPNAPVTLLPLKPPMTLGLVASGSRRRARLPSTCSSSAWLSVVPTMSVPAVVPLLPPSDQALTAWKA
ncbi:MAG: winged helix-turn-helix transcriptional regulator [Chloroflexi bacterium]|nr:winged helix-turn-helix transcriptional regulator [Chloroflexota bacterium]